MAAERQVCLDCKTLITDILTGACQTAARWQWHQTDYVSLNHATFHLDGSIPQLRNSSQSCLMCQLILQQVESLLLQSDQSDHLYFLYVTSRWRLDHPIHVGIGSLAYYERQDSTKRRARVLRLHQYLRRSHQMLLPVWQLTASVQPGLQQLPFVNLGSLESISLVRTWLAACTGGHPCHSLQRQRRLSIRALDLSQYEKGRLVLTTIDTNVDKYATLSYLWGESIRLKTETRSDKTEHYSVRVDQSNLYVKRSMSNALRPDRFIAIETYQVKDIPLNAFPTTLQHAVEVASRLDFRYIWIDSLCIVQNDEEDWGRQSAMMAQIYSNSTLTISASTCKNSTAGFLKDIHRRDVELCTVRQDNRDLQICVRDCQHLPGTADYLSSTRGWIFQERLVSPATVHFTDEGLLWECSHLQQHSHYHNLSCEPLKADWRTILSPNNRSHHIVYDAWNRWIYAYSGCVLYDNNDKFPAVAGLAKAIAEHLNLKDAYLAGLWTFDLRRGLLWRRHGRLVQSLTKLEGIAPSWSWASVNGQLEGIDGHMCSGPEKGMAMRIVEWKSHEEIEGTYGRLSSKSGDPARAAVLSVEGLLQSIRIDRHKKAGERPQPWRECGVVKGFVNCKNVECLLDEWSDSDERYLDCWCIRIGSEAMAGNRVTDHFLLLRKLPDCETEYSRIGTARCDENFDKGRPIVHSGLLESAKLVQITIR